MKGCAVMRWSVAAGRCEASSRQHSATKAWKADVSVRERCDSIRDSEDCNLEVIMSAPCRPTLLGHWVYFRVKLNLVNPY